MANFKVAVKLINIKYILILKFTGGGSKFYGRKTFKDLQDEENETPNHSTRAPILGSFMAVKIHIKVLQVVTKFWFQHFGGTTTSIIRKQASSSLLLAFASMVILGAEPHRDPGPYFCSHI
jgi:hypothetical protein